MSVFGAVESTLFLPLLGRIYASERHPAILFDQTALELKRILPPNQQDMTRQSQYTLLASAARAANTDRFVIDFLRRVPNGIIVQLGCGLDTACFRIPNGLWYAVDLPHVISYRRQLLAATDREKCIAGDAFSDDWLRQVRADEPRSPLLVTACGLFHYFQPEQISGLLRMLAGQGEVELVFDAVNRAGLFMMQKKYMRQMGHREAMMHFSVDSALELAVQTGAEVLTEEAFFLHVPRAGLSLSTRFNMAVSDRFRMLKMIHLRF